MAIFVVAMFALNYRELFRSKRIQQTRGSVELIDVSNRTLVVRTDLASEAHTFAWHQETGFFNIDGVIAPQEAARGQRVCVTYTIHRGQKIASRIEVEPVYDSQT